MKSRHTEAQSLKPANKANDKSLNKVSDQQVETVLLDPCGKGVTEGKNNITGKRKAAKTGSTSTR